MDELKIIFDVCISILKLNITVCGYTISLLEVLAFGVCGFLLLSLFYGSSK